MVGERGLVHVEASPRVLARGAFDGRPRREDRPRSGARGHRRRRGAPRMGSAHAGLRSRRHRARTSSTTAWRGRAAVAPDSPAPSSSSRCRDTRCSRTRRSPTCRSSHRSRRRSASCSVPSRRATRRRFRAGRSTSARAPSRSTRGVRWHWFCSSARFRSSRSSPPVTCTSMPPAFTSAPIDSSRALRTRARSPGNPRARGSRSPMPGFRRSLQIALWTPLVVWLAARLASETRAARLFAIAAWTAAAVGAMAKGPAALVIPAAAALVALGARRSLRPLLRLEVITGIAVVVALVAPWYLAVYARHGRVFIDELVMKHMLGRTLDHLHDTNGGEDVGISYFVKQLGYATFPWSGIAAVAALAAPSHDDGSRRSHARALLFGGALVAFALVSSMGTKFHHYGLVVLPGAAMLAGIWLDERLGEASSPARGAPRAAASAAAFAAAALVVLLVARDLALAPSDGHAPSGAARLVHLMTYRYDRRWPSAEAFAPVIGGFAVMAAAGCVALASRRWRARASLAFGGGALLFTGLLLDRYLAAASSDGGQRGVYEAYYRSRGRFHRAARRVSAELEGRELLHRQQRRALHRERRAAAHVPRRSQASGREHRLLRHRARARRRAPRRAGHRALLRRDDRSRRVVRVLARARRALSPGHARQLTCSRRCARS